MANVNDKFLKTSPALTKLASGINETATTVPLEQTGGFVTDTAVVVVVDRVNSEGKLTPEKAEVMLGVMGSSGLENVTRGLNGSKKPHSVGAIVEASIASGEAWNRLIETLIEVMGQDGKIKDNALAENTISASKLKVGEISPKAMNMREFYKYKVLPKKEGYLSYGGYVEQDLAEWGEVNGIGAGLWKVEFFSNFASRQDDSNSEFNITVRLAIDGNQTAEPVIKAIRTGGARDGHLIGGVGVINIPQGSNGKISFKVSSGQNVLLRFYEGVVILTRIG